MMFRFSYNYLLKRHINEIIQVYHTQEYETYWFDIISFQRKLGIVTVEELQYIAKCITGTSVCFSIERLIKYLELYRWCPTSMKL